MQSGGRTVREREKKAISSVPQVCCIESANLIKLQVKFAPEIDVTPTQFSRDVYTWRWLFIPTLRSFCFAFVS